MKKTVLIIGMLSAVYVGALIMQKPFPESSKESILRTAFYSDVPTFHYSSSNKGSYNCSLYTMPWVFDGLFRKGENDIPMPAIAERFKISSDQKTYTFYLRDAKWSDGTEVTAYDFEYAWKKLIDPQSKSMTILPELFSPIQNVRKFIRGECLFEDVGIAVVDNKTIIIDLEYPAQYFLETLCNPLFFPAPKHIAEQDDGWSNKPGFVCNGPFYLKKWQKNSEILFRKNPLYWDHEHVYLDGIDVAIVPNALTALNLYEKKELDWIGAPFMKMSYDTSYKTLTEKKEDATVYFFGMNNDKYPFNNKKLRKALSYAIDRRAITENLFHDTAVPVMGALPVSLRLKNTPYFQDNNVKLAKDLLNEALEEIDKSLDNFPEIELLYNSDAEFLKKMCLAAQDEWRKNLGLKISLKGMSGASLCIDTIQKGDYQMAIISMSAVIFDPLMILQLFENKSDAVNRCNWENKKYKEILQHSNDSLGEIERTRLLMEAEEILMDEMPFIPICSMNKSYAKNPKLRGENLSYLQFVDFKSAYFEDARRASSEP